MRTGEGSESPRGKLSRRRREAAMVVDYVQKTKKTKAKKTQSSRVRLAVSTFRHSPSPHPARHARARHTAQNASVGETAAETLTMTHATSAPSPSPARP